MPQTGTSTRSSNKRAAQRKAETASLTSVATPERGAAAAGKKGSKQLVTPTQAAQAAKAAQQAAAKAKAEAAALKAAEQAARREAAKRAAEAGKLAEKAKFDRFVKQLVSLSKQGQLDQEAAEKDFKGLQFKHHDFSGVLIRSIQLMGKKVVVKGKLLDDYVPSDQEDDDNGAAGEPSDDDMAEAALAAAAAEEHVAPENPYITLAKSKNWAPDELGDGHPDVIDLTHMNKPAEGFPNIEAMRVAACMLSQSKAVTDLPEECRPLALKLIATAYTQRAGQELDARALKARRAVGEVIKVTDKFRRGSDPRPLARSPGKIDQAAKALAEPALPSDTLVEGLKDEVLSALAEALAAANKAVAAKDQSPGLADLTSPGEAGSAFLRSMLQKYAKTKRPENTVAHFARFATESLDKVAAAADTAAKKGEFQVAWQYTEKGIAMKDKLNEFMDLAKPIGFPRARDFFLAVGDPFVGVTDANYQHVVGLAKNAQYMEIVASLGDNFPKSAIQYRKRERKPERGFGYDKGSDSESGGEQAPKRRRSGNRGRPFCTHCRKPGHTIDTCFQLKGKPSKAKGDN